MVRDGQLLMNRRGGYAVARKLDLVAGTVIANPDGFGFLKCDDGGEDLFLPPGELRKALHGDRVLASITGVDRRGRRERPERGRPERGKPERGKPERGKPEREKSERGGVRQGREQERAPGASHDFSTAKNVTMR